MNALTRKQIIDEIVTRTKTQKSLAQMPFAIQVMYDNDVHGSFIVNDTRDPQNDVEIDNYGFYVEYFAFPCVGIEFSQNKIQFKCALNPILKTMTLSEVAESIFMNLMCKPGVDENIELTMVLDNGVEYKLEMCENEVFVEYDKSPYFKQNVAALGLFETTPVIDVDNSGWANYAAMQVWREEQRSMNEMASNRHFDDVVDEEDGGGAAAGGDAGGAAAASGDAGGSTAAADVGDVAAEMNGAGIKTTDVLGDYKPGKGFMGDNFYLPVRAKCPMHHWEIANGGSKRKRSAKNKNKKYAYEKGMKVVVDMFEGDEEKKSTRKAKYTKEQILEAIKHWQAQIDAGNYKDEMSESKRMLLEFMKTWTYEELKDKDWGEIRNEVEEANAKNTDRKAVDVQIRQAYNLWYAANYITPPNTKDHGALNVCWIGVDRDPYHPGADYLERCWIHGIYADGTDLVDRDNKCGIGAPPKNAEGYGVGGLRGMSRALASAYMKLHGVNEVKTRREALNAMNDLAPDADPNKSKFNFGTEQNPIYLYGVVEWNPSNKIDENSFEIVEDEHKVIMSSDGTVLTDMNLSQMPQSSDFADNSKHNAALAATFSNWNPKSTADTLNPPVAPRQSDFTTPEYDKALQKHHQEHSDFYDKKHRGFFIKLKNVEYRKDDLIAGPYSTKENAEIQISKFLANVEIYALTRLSQTKDCESMNSKGNITTNVRRNGFYLIQDSSGLVPSLDSYAIGPFESSVLATSAARKFEALSKNDKSPIGPFKLAKKDIQKMRHPDKDKAQKSERIKFPVYVFNYGFTMGPDKKVQCQNVVLAENISSALKRFRAQWLGYFSGVYKYCIGGNYNSSIARGNLTLDELKKDFSTGSGISRHFTDIKVEEVDADDEAALQMLFNTAKQIGDPWTNPRLKILCADEDKFKYIVGKDQKRDTLDTSVDYSYERPMKEAEDMEDA